MPEANALTTAFADVLTRLLGFIPGFLSVLAILIVGWIIARILRKIVITLLDRVGLDPTLDKAGIAKIIKDSGTKLTASEILGAIVYWVIMIAVFIGITNYLGLTAVSAALNSLLAYVPNILAALIIVVVAFILGNSLAAMIKGAARQAEIARPDLLGNIAKWVIVGLAIIIALDQLNIDTSILKLALTYLVGASAVALALAFGLGSSSVAQNITPVLFIRERFKVGDRITLAEHSGEIKQISLTYVTIATADQGTVDIPNSVLMQAIIKS